MVDLDSSDGGAEVVEGPRAARPVRRSFSAEDKRRLVSAYDATPRGQKGAMLRRERLYDSHITEWRAAIAAGTLDAPPKRGRPRGSKKTARSPEQVRIGELERQVKRLEAEAAKKDEVIAAKAQALEVLGKVSVCAVAQARSGLKMGVWSPADVVRLWSCEAVEK